MTDPPDVGSAVEPAGGEAVLRAGIGADVPFLRRIAEGEQPLPAGGYPEAIDAYYAYLVEHGRVVVAEVDGVAVGFGAVSESGRGTHLADLFVERRRQSSGIGRRLLGALFRPTDWPRTTFSSDDPRALPLYTRFGMRPLWPNLYLAGDGRRLATLASLAVEPVDHGEVAELERTWWGIDRPVQHAYWAGQPDAASFVVRSAGRPVAAGHARARLAGTGRWIDTFCVAPGEDSLGPTLAAMRSSVDDAGRIGGCLPGPHPAVPALIEAGFRVVDRDIFQASDPTLVDAERWVVNTGLL